MLDLHIFDKALKLTWIKSCLNSLMKYKNIVKIKYLELNSNEISELPDEFYTLKFLEKLHLEENKLTKLSPKIGNLKSLNMLSLRRH